MAFKLKYPRVLGRLNAILNSFFNIFVAYGMDIEKNSIKMRCIMICYNIYHLVVVVVWMPRSPLILPSTEHLSRRTFKIQ